MTDQLTVDDVATLDDGEVYVRLGAALLRTGTDDERARGFGEQWFNWKLPEMGRRLGDEETLARLGDDPDPAAVAEVLAKLGDPTTVACAAVLVVRRGLEEVCEDDDDD